MRLRPTGFFFLLTALIEGVLFMSDASGKAEADMGITRQLTPDILTLRAEGSHEFHSRAKEGLWLEGIRRCSAG
jgi:hypothetical protein